MDKNDRIFNSSFHLEDSRLTEKAKFKNAQVIFLRKIDKKLSGVLTILERFFESYVKRRDVKGNLMIKGILKTNAFLQMENYFTINLKCLNVIDIVQINVFLFKADIFSDYNEYQDKSNMTREEIREIVKSFELLDYLRKKSNEMKINEEMNINSNN